MRDQLRLGVAGVLAMAVLTGCTDHDAINRRAAIDQYTQALALVQEANRGYVDQGSLSDPQVSVYRQKKLEEAVAKLDAAVQNRALPQQTQARRALAAANESLARLSAAGALQDWGSVQGRLDTLISRLSAVFYAQARAQTFNIDESPLLGKLKDIQDQAAPSLRAYRDQQRTINNAMSQLVSERDGHRKVAAAAQTKSLGLQDQSVQKQGQAQLDLAVQALDAQRDADKANAAAEAIDVRIEINQSELAIVNRQIELAESADKFIAAQITAVEKRAQTFKTLRDEALGTTAESAVPTSKKAAVQALDAEFKSVAADYDKLVAAPLAQAVARADKAIEQLKQAGASKTSQLDLLAAQSLAAYIRSMQVSTAGAYGQTLSVIAERAKTLLPDQQGQYAATASQMQQQKQQIAAASTTMLDEAAALAGELSKTTDDVGAAAAAAARSLQGYRERIAAQPGTSAVPAPAEKTPAPAPVETPAN